MKNRKSAKGSSSKYLGIHFSNWHDRWRAVIKPTGQKNIIIGCYKNELDAVYAYNFAAKIIHGEFANLNEITPPENTTWIEERVLKYIKKREEELCQ